jgi:hypothetical protein
VPADGTSAANWKEAETSVRLRFMGSSRTSHSLSFVCSWACQT